ncbi:TPA: hypothetical protein ACH3X1_016014 [Trebouxia sp. C0004]
MVIFSCFGLCDPYLPLVVRGKNKTALNGYLKSALDRYSCCGGDFERTKAERQDPAVGNLVLCMLKAVIDSLQVAFPRTMLDIYSRHVLNALVLSCCKHGPK